MSASGPVLSVSSESKSAFEAVRTYEDQFKDVTTDKWFYKYVKTAYEYGLANGTSSSAFSPDSKFTVAQALTAAANIHAAYNKGSIASAASGEAWYVPYVSYCVNNGIITDAQFSLTTIKISRAAKWLLYLPIFYRTASMPQCAVEIFRMWLLRSLAMRL